MNDNPNEKSSATQCAQILKWLQDGHSITSLEALTKFQCMRLASRISDLKSRGVNIVKTMVKNEQNGKRYASYSLN